MLSSDPAAVRAFLEANDLDFASCVQAFGIGSDKCPFVKAAQDLKAAEGELEVDDVAVVSEGDDDGAYVMTWTWVSFSDAGIGSAALEQLVSFVSTHPSRATSVSHQLAVCIEWLQETLSNFSEELDDIASESPIRSEALPIQWKTSSGTYAIRPHESLRELLAVSRLLGFEEHAARAVEIYLDRYGDKLDLMLTAHG